MATGSDLLNLARKHLGETYVNVQIPKNDPNWKGPWDCAEFMSWLVFQTTGKLYGCTNNDAKPEIADAYTGAWARDSRAIGTRISVEEAAGTVGAFLLRYPLAPGTMGHIALSDGRGGTVEAMGKAFGVAAAKAAGRKWDTGVLVPGIDYGKAGPSVEVPGPSLLYAPDLPNMNPDKIMEIQRALKANSFDPGPLDGSYGPATAKAVADFQNARGLVADGQVGSVTARALGIDLLASRITKAAPAEGAGSMNPLIMIAAGILPEILKTLAADTDGAAAGAVRKAVGDVAGTTDASVARQTIGSDPGLSAQLQMKLAEIAHAFETTRQQSQRDAAQRQNDQALAAIRADLDDVRNVRERATDWAKMGGPMSWGPLLVSGAVTIGFFVILVVMILVAALGIEVKNKDIMQIINITIGALAAAFATVVNFWLGSSQSSRFKDVANLDLQAEQSRQTKDMMKAQADTFDKAVQNSANATIVQRQSEKPAASKPSNFQRCVDIVLVHEGGFSNDPADPGGATQFGITLATLEKSRDVENLTPDDVKNLTKQEACEIYRRKYWNVLRCDDLPAGLDLVVFDFGVNAGPLRSAKLLQKIVGAEADGSIGPATVAAANAANAAAAIASFSQDRLTYYRGLSTWPRFGNGWTNRTNAVLKAATEMCGSNRLAA